MLPPVVDTEMTAARKDKKITTEELVKGLINGLKKDQFTIRIGDAKLVYYLNRFFPTLTFGLVNPKNQEQILKQNSKHESI